MAVTSQRLTVWVLLASLFVFSNNSLASEDHFLAAEKALKQGDIDTFNRHSAKLTSHPIYAYLHYQYLKSELEQQPVSTIEVFLNRYPDSYYSKWLRIRYLKHLAKNQRWDDYLALYKPSDDAELHCHYLNAKHQTGDSKPLLNDAESLWLTGESQDKACDAVFRVWQDNGKLTQQRVWQRIKLAMQQNNLGLANFLSRYLTDADNKKKVALWVKLHHNPYNGTKLDLKDTAINRDILAHANARLALRNADSGKRMWNQLKDRYQFNDQQKTLVFRAIAIKHAIRGQKPAVTWFDKSHADHLTDVHHAWRARVALKHHNWQAVIRAIDGMPKALSEKPCWRYWHARALAETGQRAKALPELNALAKERGYYGFLASNYLKLPMQITNNVPANLEEKLATMAKDPAMQRVKFLYQLKRKGTAAAEFRHMLTVFDEEQQYLATKLLAKWGWHSLAILSTSRINYKDDLALRFPLKFKKRIMKQAQAKKLDPAFVFAIARQESAFMHAVKSHAGAIGLMQVMPYTAARYAKQAQIKIRSTDDIVDLDNNIRLGTTILQKLLRQYDGQYVFAAAAYNAGEHRVKRWRQGADGLEVSIWIENVPFHETRNYLKHVSAFHAIYSHRLGKKPNLDHIFTEL